MGRQAAKVSRVYSFDVFDTCLLRACAFPSDIFTEVAYALSGRARGSEECTFVHDFVSTRMKAEQAVRAKADREDVTLSEIWRELAGNLPFDGWNSGMEIELDLERRHLRPNRAVLSMVQAARESGARIVFVSDMYLPAAFIREQLACHGFFKDGDGLFVSSEVGLTKRSGNLFRHALRAEGVAPDSVRHLGDHPVSDVQVPRSLGIDAHLVKEASLGLCERALVNIGLESGHVGSRLAAGSRAFRLSEEEPNDGYRGFVAAFLGPFLLTFASWVLARARRDGVRRLYFLSRDCYMLSHVARILASASGIETRYLCVSRQSLFLPSVREISEAGMPWVRRFFETPTIERVMAKLDLTDSIVPELLRKALAAKDGRQVIRTGQEWKTFWGVVTGSPARQLLEAKICERREQAIRYLEEQGLRDRVNWAVVDLGWQLTCQTSLRLILDPDPVQGYYLGLRWDRPDPPKSGRAAALFYTDPPDRAAAAETASVFPRGPLLEHLLGLAPHGTVHHYAPSASGMRPVCRDVKGPAAEYIGRFERLVTEFAMENAGLASELGNPANARAILHELTDTFFGQPKREWVESLRFLEVAADQNNLDAMPLATPITWRQFLLNCLPGRLRRPFPLTVAPWPEASLCISPERIQGAIAVRTAASRLARSARSWLAVHPDR